LAPLSQIFQRLRSEDHRHLPSRAFDTSSQPTLGVRALETKGPESPQKKTPKARVARALTTNTPIQPPAAQTQTARTPSAHHPKAMNIQSLCCPNPRHQQPARSISRSSSRRDPRRRCPKQDFCTSAPRPDDPMIRRPPSHKAQKPRRRCPTKSARISNPGSDNPAIRKPPSPQTRDPRHRCPKRTPAPQTPDPMIRRSEDHLHLKPEILDTVAPKGRQHLNSQTQRSNDPKTTFTSSPKTSTPLPQKDASISNPGSNVRMVRRPPSSQIQDSLRFQPEGRWRIESSKDLCDTASFKDLKILASFARPASPRRVCWSFGGKVLAPPQTSRRTDRSSDEPSNRLSQRFGEENDITTTAPKSRRPSAIPISGPPAREALSSPSSRTLAGSDPEGSSPPQACEKGSLSSTQQV
jgi:hypothetical protein